MPADDLLPGSPALNGRLQWFARNAESLAAAEYWRPDEQLYPSAATEDRRPPIITTTGTGGLTSGTLYLFGGLLLVPGVAITGASFWSGATAAVAPVNQWACLVDARNLSVLTKGTDKGAEAWAANTKKSFALSYTPPAALGDLIPAYLGLVQNAATAANLFGVNLGGATRPNSEPPILAASSTAGLTDPASLGATAGALTAFNGHAYAYLT